MYDIFSYTMAQRVIPTVELSKSHIKSASGLVPSNLNIIEALELLDA